MKQLKIGITPLHINEFIEVFNISSGTVSSSYFDYLETNRAIHDYGSFKTVNEWFNHEIKEYNSKKNKEYNNDTN